MSRTATPPARTRTVAYIRVSTDKQAEHGVSLEAQRAKLQAYAALYDLDLVAVEVDAGLSASTLDRPGLQAALAMLRTRKADALLVVKLDRLTRSIRDMGDLVDRYFGAGKTASLLSVGDQIDTRTAAGRMVLNLLTTVAQWEREATGERTAAAMAHKAAAGEYTGGKVPYGFTLAPCGVALVACDAEQAVVEQVRELRASGLSLRAVSAELDRRGILSRAGKAFAAPQIARMVAA